MAVFQNDVDVVVNGATGQVVSSVPVQRDITEDFNLSELADRARAALTANATFLAATPPGTTAAQLQFLYNHLQTITKECSGLIRLQGRTIEHMRDLLQSTEGT